MYVCGVHACIYVCCGGCTFVYRCACRGHRFMWGHLLRQYGGRIPHLSPVPSDSTSLVNRLFQGSPIAASRVLGSQADLHLHTLFAQGVGVLLLVGPSLPQHSRSGQSWAKHAQAYGRRMRTEPPGCKGTHHSAHRAEIFAIFVAILSHSIFLPHSNKPEC